MEQRTTLLSLPDHELGLTTIEQALPEDFRYIDALQKHHVNNIGFVPRTAIENHLERLSYLLLTINGQPTGYMMSAGGIRKPYRLIQLAIESEAWRTGLGSILIGLALDIAARKPSPNMTATVREGLPMNPTVLSTGALPTGRDTTPKARRKELIHYAWHNSLSHPHRLLLPSDTVTRHEDHTPEHDTSHLPITAPP